MHYQDEEKRTEHNLFVCSGKSEAELALNILYYWNYWQTRGIARPLCNSRSTCIAMWHLFSFLRLIACGHFVSGTHIGWNTSPSQSKCISALLCTTGSIYIQLTLLFIMGFSRRRLHYTQLHMHLSVGLRVFIYPTCLYGSGIPESHRLRAVFVKFQQEVWTFAFPSFPIPFLLSYPFLPSEVGPLKSSEGVWGSAVSSPSGVTVAITATLYFLHAGHNVRTITYKTALLDLEQQQNQQTENHKHSNRKKTEVCLHHNQLSTVSITSHVIKHNND